MAPPPTSSPTASPPTSSAPLVVLCSSLRRCELPDLPCPRSCPCASLEPPAEAAARVARGPPEPGSSSRAGQAAGFRMAMAVAARFVGTQRRFLAARALCAGGGMLAAGATHLAITPLDVLKVNMKGGCKFGLYEYFKKKYSDVLVDGNKSTIYFLSSASAQIIADVALCPFESVKVRVQTQPMFAKGLIDGFPRVYATEGFSGFYRGLLPLWGRNLPNSKLTQQEQPTCKPILTPKWAT